MSTAGYIAQGEHLRDPARPLGGFGAMVANASLLAGELEAACDPGAIILSSYNAQMLTLAGPNSSFFGALRAAMMPFVLRDSFGEPVLGDENGIFFDYRILEGADAYAAWIAANNPIGRGLYIDEVVAAIPPRRVAELPDPALADFWPAWRDRFLERLRLRLGDSVPIVGNTAGWMSPVLSGICIETAHVSRMGLVMALARYAIQWTRGRRPVVQIDWAGRWEFPTLGLYRGEFLPGA